MSGYEKPLITSEIPELDEGGVHIIEGSGFGNYGGRLITCLGGRLVLVEVIDCGWNVTETGEVDDDGTITREASGVDSLLTRVTDLSTGQAAETEEYIPDDNIHGVIYAAQCMEDAESNNSERYKNYLAERIASILPGAELK